MPPLYEPSLATSRPSRSSAQTSRALNVVSFDDEDSESAEVDPYVFDIKEKKKGHKKHHRIPTLKLHSPTVDSVSPQKSLRILSSYSGEEKVPSLKIKLPEPVPKISTSIISPTKDSINHKLKISKDESELCKTTSIFKKAPKVCLSPQNAEVSSSVEEIVNDSLVKSMPDSCADSTSNEGNSSSDNEKCISSAEDKVASPEVRNTNSSKTPPTLNLKISSKKLCHLGSQQWYSENSIQKESPLLTPSTKFFISSVVPGKETESSISLDLKTPPTSHIQSDGVKPTVRKRGRPRLNPIPAIIPSLQVQSESLEEKVPCSVPPSKVVSKNEQIVQSVPSKPCTSAVLPCKEVTQSGSFKPSTSALIPCKVVTKNEQILQSGSFKPCASSIIPCKVVTKNEQILQSGSFKPCASAVSPCKVISKNDQLIKKLEDQKLSSSQQSIENQSKEDLINLRLKELDIKESKLKQLSISYNTKTPTLASNSPSIAKKVDESIRRSSRLYKPLPAETVKKKIEFGSHLLKSSKLISTSKQSSNKIFPEKTSAENLRTPASSEQPDYFESLKQQIEMPLYVEKFPSDKSEVSSSTSELAETIKPIPKIAGVPCNFQPFTHDTPILDAHMVVEGHTSHTSTVISDDRNIGSSLMVSTLPKPKSVKPNLESTGTPVVKKSGYMIENLIVKANEKESVEETFTAVANTCEISLLKVASSCKKETFLPLNEKCSIETEKAVVTDSIDDKHNLKDLLPIKYTNQKCETEIVKQPSEILFTKQSFTVGKEEIGIDATGGSLPLSEKFDFEKEKKPEYSSFSNDIVKKQPKASSVLRDDNSSSQPIDKTDERFELTNLTDASSCSVHVSKQDQISVSDTNQKLQVSSLEGHVQQKIIHDDSTSSVSVIKKLCESTLPSATTLHDLKMQKQTPIKTDLEIKKGKVGNQSLSVIKLIDMSSSLENANISSETLKELDKSVLSSRVNLNSDLASNCKPSISNVNAETKEIREAEDTGALLRSPIVVPPSAANIESETQIPKGDSDIISFKDILMEAALAADIDSDDLTEGLCPIAAETVLNIAKGSKGTHDGSSLDRRSSLDFPENFVGVGVKFPAAVTGAGGCRSHSKKHDFIEKLSANVYNAKKDSSKGLMEIIFDLDKRAKQTSEVEEQEQSLDFDDKCQTLPTKLNSAEVRQDVSLGLSSEKVQLGLKDEIHSESNSNIESFLLCKDSSEQTTDDKFKSQSLVRSPVAVDSPNETTSVSEEEVNFFREVMESVPELGKKKPCFEPLLKLKDSQDVSTEHACSKTKEQLIENIPKSITSLDVLVSDSRSCASSKIVIKSVPNEGDKADSQLEKPSCFVKKQITKSESELPSSEEVVIESLSEVAELNKQKAISEITDVNKQKAKSEITEIYKQNAKSEITELDKQKAKSEITELDKQKAKSQITELDKQKAKSEITELDKQKVKSEITESDKQKTNSEITELNKQQDKSEFTELDKQKAKSEITELNKQKTKAEMTEGNKQKTKSEISKLKKQEAKSNSENIIRLSCIENFAVEKFNSQAKAESNSDVEIEDCSRPVVFKTEGDLVTSNCIVELTNTFGENSNSVEEKEETLVINDEKLDVAAVTTDKYEIKSHKVSAMKLDNESITSSENPSVFNKMLEYYADSCGSLPVEKMANQSEKKLDCIDMPAIKVDKFLASDANDKTVCNKEKSEICLSSIPLASTKIVEEVQISNANKSSKESIYTDIGKNTSIETLQNVSTELLHQPETSIVYSHSEELKDIVVSKKQQKIPNTEIIPDFEGNEVSAEMRYKVKLEEKQFKQSDFFSNMPVKHDTELALKSSVEVSSSHTVPCEAISVFKELLNIPIKAKLQIEALNSSCNECVELEQVVPKLSSLAKVQIDLDESKSVCQFFSSDSLMENLKILPSGVETVNSQTKRPIDSKTFSTSDTLPQLIVGKSSQPVTSSFAKKANLQSKHITPKELIRKEASESMLEDETYPQSYVGSETFLSEKRKSKEKIGTCSTTFSNFSFQAYQKKTKFACNVLDSSTSSLSENSKTCNLSPENITTENKLSPTLDDSLSLDGSKIASECQIGKVSCNLQTGIAKLDDPTQISVQVPEVSDFKLHVESKIKDENLNHKLISSFSAHPSNEVQSLFSTTPSVVDNFDKFTCNNKQEHITTQQIDESKHVHGGLSEEDQLPFCFSASHTQVPNTRNKIELTNFTPDEAETLQINELKIPSDCTKLESPTNEPNIVCTEHNAKNYVDRNSPTCQNQKPLIISQDYPSEITQIGELNKDSCYNLAKQMLINKTEETKKTCKKEISFTEKPIKDLTRQKIEIPFIRSFQDNSMKRMHEKIKVNKVENFHPRQYFDTGKGAEKIKFNDKRKTVEAKITGETNEFSSSYDSKKADIECSAKNYTQHCNMKQKECYATVLPKEGILPVELGSLSECGKINIDECKEFPILFDLSSIPLPPVINQDNEEHNTSVVSIVKGSSLCDSNDGNFVAEKMARKNKNSETLAAQREANNGDTNEGEHSPKRMNTRQRSKSTERDLVAVAEVEKKTGRLRRSSRGDKSVSETIDKHDSDKNGTNNNQCLESIAELNENSVKDDGQLFNETSDIPSSTLNASIDNPADIPMPDVANVPLPEPKSASVIQIVSEIPVAISDNPLPPPDVQSIESTVDQLEKKDEPDANKAVEVAATCDSASDKKDGKTSTSFRSKRRSTEETTSHSKRRGRSRSRSASSSSDRSSSKRKSSRKSRHSSSRRRSPSSGRNHRKSSRYSKRSSHKTEGRSRSRSVENASSTKKRDERKDEKEKEMKKNKDDKKLKEDKKDKEERVEKEFEECKSKASKESDETLDKPEFHDMSKEDITDESADKNDKDKKLKDRTSSSGDRDSNKREHSSDKDSRRPSSRRDSSKNKDIVLSEESSCKEGASNPRETKTSEEVPKSSKVSPDSKNVERSLNEENETEKEGSTDDPATEADAVKHEPDVIFKSARKVNLLRPKSIGEEEQEKPKRRKWGSSATAKSSLEISSNSLKTLIPDVKPLSDSEVTLKYSSESSEEEHEAEVEINLKDADHNELLDDLMSDSEEKYLEKTVEVKKDEDNSKVEEDIQPEISPIKRKRSVSTDARKKEKHDRREEKRESRRDRIVKEVSPRRHKKHSPEKTERRPLIARNVSAVEAGPYSYKLSIAPPQNPVSRVIIINNLTRPFTVKAITDLLLRTGRLAENGFWMDRIKSTCLAMFETIDQAEETRSALHGVKWPADNNKNLFVDFATEKDLKEKLSDKDNSLPTYSAEEPRRDRRKFEGPIREWDLAKVGERSPGEREREKERQRREREEERERDKRRREQSPKEERKPKKPPSRGVDDLFKKTKARPCIYWLPLTPEQIVEKEALRRKKMAESERMLAEIKEQERLRQKKREKERELREKEREQREKEREQREKERNAKRSKSRSHRRSRSRSPRKSPRRSPRRTRRSASRDSRKSHRRSRSRSRS